MRRTRWTLVAPLLLAACEARHVPPDVPEPSLPRAAGEIIAFLRGETPFDSLELADSVTFHVAPEGGGGRVTMSREVLRDRGSWSVPVGGTRLVLTPPESYRRASTWVGQHAVCNPVSLATRVASLADFPHIGVRLDAGESASCLQTWNVTLVFARDTTPLRLAAVVYDQWEW